MTLDERIKRARWYLHAIESKAGAADTDVLGVALSDAANLGDDVLAITRELVRRQERIRAGRPA